MNYADIVVGFAVLFAIFAVAQYATVKILVTNRSFLSKRHADDDEEPRRGRMPERDFPRLEARVK